MQMIHVYKLIRLYLALFVSDTDSIATCFSILRIYEAAPGSKINISKMKGLWLQGHLKIK